LVVGDLLLATALMLSNLDEYRELQALLLS
jgi:hypothetical protein